MTESPFDALEAEYPGIIEAMPDEFNAHQFILHLAHRHQRLYVLALALYADTNRPFQIAHGEIARRLHNHPRLVTKIGDRLSKDIFGESQEASVWRKVR
jgi:hypothetical protein